MTDTLGRILDELVRIRKAQEVSDLLTVPEAARLLRIDETAARRWMAERELIHELQLPDRERPVRRVERQELLHAVKRDGKPEPRPTTRSRKVQSRGLSRLASAGKRAS